MSSVRPAPGFELQTSIGPVDVLAVTDSPDGVRELKVHVIRDTGYHDVRWIQIRGRELEHRPGFFELTYSARDPERETYRVTRVIPEDGEGYVEITQETAGDQLFLWLKADGGENTISVRRVADGVTERAVHELDPARLDDASYVESIRHSLEHVYGGSPFENNPERDLLMAVVTAGDWDRYLEVNPASGDSESKRRLERVCVAAAAISRVSCFASMFTPWAWVACVPSTGISIACLAYAVQEVFINNSQENGCSDGFVCPTGDGPGPEGP